MSRKNEHFFNVTRNCYRESGQVLPAIGVTLSWVESGVSFRELSFVEVMAIRSQEAQELAPLAPLAPVEVSGCIWDPPIRDKSTRPERYALVGAAYQFYRESFTEALA